MCSCILTSNGTPYSALQSCKRNKHTLCTTFGNAVTHTLRYNYATVTNTLCTTIMHTSINTRCELPSCTQLQTYNINFQHSHSYKHTLCTIIMYTILNIHHALLSCNSYKHTLWTTILYTVTNIICTHYHCA